MAEVRGLIDSRRLSVPARFMSSCATSSCQSLHTPHQPSPSAMPNIEGIADSRASTSRTARYQSTSGDPSGRPRSSHNRYARSEISSCSSIALAFPSTLRAHRVIEQPYDPLRSTPATLRISPCHKAARGDGIVIERIQRGAVITACCGNGLDDRNDVILSQLVENVEDEFTFDHESCRRLAFNDRPAGLGVDNSRQDCWSMTHGTDDASAIPDVRSDCLQAFRGRIVIKRCVTRGREEDSILFFIQIRCPLELRVQLHHEWMVGIVVNGLAASRQEWRLQRIEVQTKRTSFGSQVHLEASGYEDFVRMQSLGEEQARLVASRIDRPIEARDRNENPARESPCHDLSPLGSRTHT